MKIGLCGGTFDPFHRGHLDPILAVRDAMQWDRVIWIPAYVQPFKADAETASAFHRFAMAVLATEKYDDFYVSPLELERGEISYTIDTLKQLRAEYPGATFDWIIGDDNLEKLHLWKSIDEIFELANVVVLTRDHAVIPSGARDLGGWEAHETRHPPTQVPRYARDDKWWHVRVTNAANRGTHGAIVIAENPAVSVSSTDIRMRIRSGESIDDLVDPRVSRYIQHNGLYRKGQS